MRIALGHRPLYTLGHLFPGVARGIAIAVNGSASLSTKQLVQRHAGALGLDVPQRDIDSRYGIVLDRSAAPETARIHRMIKVGNHVGVFSDDKWLQIFFDDRGDCRGSKYERRAA